MGTNHYETEKLTFAAYLIASKRCDFVGVKPIQGTRNVVFILSAPPLNDDITGFFNGSATVSALRLAETLSTLKSAAYEVRRNNGGMH